MTRFFAALRACGTLHEIAEIVEPRFGDCSAAMRCHDRSENISLIGRRAAHGLRDHNGYFPCATSAIHHQSVVARSGRRAQRALETSRPDGPHRYGNI